MGKLKISVDEIEIGIAGYFGYRQNIIVPKLSWGFNWIHECDVFILKKSGYAVEVEIKRTKSDLVKDLQKKHQHKDDRIKELYYAIPKEYLDDWSKLIPDHAGIISYEKYEDDIWDRKRRKYGGKKGFRMYVRRCRSAKPNKNARKLTTEEKLKVAHLGCMRIWKLKQYKTKLTNNFI